MNMTGVWLGQTLGYPSAIHIWIILHTGDDLIIYTHWLGFEKNKAEFRAKMVAGYSRSAHIWGTQSYLNIQNENTFRVSGWVQISDDTDELKTFDVYFQRRDTKLVAYLVNIYIGLFQWSPALLRLLNR